VTTAPIRILVAEDHTFVREMLCRILTAEPDLEVVGSAADGDEAVRLAVDLQPDVALLDLVLPSGSGLAAIQLLRERAPDVRVIVLTGQVQPAPQRAALRLGVRGYLLKTASADAIVSAIRAVQAGSSAFDPSVTRQLGSLGASDDGGVPTPRELAVLRQAAAGLTNREIADQLGVRESTVEFHLHNLYRKFGVGNRTEMVDRGRRAGWVT
jgi:DNA-binding NarL/FixJ family response regulator